MPDQPTSMQTPSGSGTLSTRQIVFLVLASVAPITGVVGILPLALMLSGPSAAAMFLLAGLILFCFGVGYGEVGRCLGRIDGLWSYIRAGLGAVPAGGGAWLALLGYTSVLIGALGAGCYYFKSVIADKFGVDLPFWVYAVALMIAVGLLASRQIDVSARVVAILVFLELLVIGILLLFIVIDRGLHAFPLDAFKMDVILGGDPGLALMYAFIAFLSFEAASLFASDAINPARSVPRATLMTIAIVTAFFVLCSWIVIGALGVSATQDMAAENGGDLVFFLSDEFAGSGLSYMMGLLLLTSLFATTLGLTNIAARYLRVLGQERLLPGWFAETSPHTGAPVRAVVAQTTLALVVVVGLLVAGADPYVEVSGVFFGVGALALVSAYCVAGIAVIAYFSHGARTSILRQLVVPAVGALGLLGALILIVDSFDSVTGLATWYISLLPWFVATVFVLGAVRGWMIRSRAQVDRPRRSRR